MTNTKHGRRIACSRAEHEAVGWGLEKGPPPGKGGGRKGNYKTTGTPIFPSPADSFKAASHYATEVLARIGRL